MKYYCRKIFLLTGTRGPCGKHHQALIEDWRKVWFPCYLLILCSTCLSRLNLRTSLLIDFSAPSRTNLISPQFPVYKIRVKILLNYSNCLYALLGQLKNVNIMDLKQGFSFSTSLELSALDLYLNAAIKKSVIPNSTNKDFAQVLVVANTKNVILN